MNIIEHLIEPKRVFLIWRAESTATPRMRRVVGVIEKNVNSGDFEFNYLKGTEDYTEARADGFKGHPAFYEGIEKSHKNPFDVFMRRLPPTDRDDFPDYLKRHRLPLSKNHSPMVLLGYTGGMLPSDTFEFCADFSETASPLELIVEVAGFRHQKDVSVDDIYTGDSITFKAEPENLKDRKAIAIFRNGQRIGYVARQLTEAFHCWMKKGFSVSATVERINGKPGFPSIYLFVVVR